MPESRRLGEIGQRKRKRAVNKLSQILQAACSEVSELRHMAGLAQRYGDQLLYRLSFLADVLEQGLLPPLALDLVQERKI